MHRPWGGRALDGGQINGSERLNCQRCSGWDVLAHHHVFCLWMDAAPIHPYIHPSIHPSIHCGILCLSYPVRETDRYTYPETGTHRTKIGTDVYTQKQRCRDIETETERDPQGEEGQRWREKLILLRAGGRWHKQAEFGHDCALTGSRLGPCLQQGTLILTPRGSNVQWLRSTVRN